MSSATEEAVSPPKRCGGRPQSEGWINFSFEKVEGDKGKCLAKCKKCLNVLQNTSLIRMANHRKRCGPLSDGSSHEVAVPIKKPAQKTPQPVKNEVPQSQPALMFIAEPEFMEESPTPVERVNQTAMEIINEDINRHRRSSGKSSKNKFGSIDSALSSFLIGCNLPFDVVDTSHFKKFVHALNPNCMIPTSSQLKQRVLSRLQPEETPSSSKRRRYNSESEDD